MNDKMTYAIIQSYKGMFKKKHVGNTQLIITSVGKNFMLLELLGEHTEYDNVYWAVKRLEGSTEFMDSLIFEMKSTIDNPNEKFVVLDEVECVPKEIKKNIFKLTLKSIGKYLKSKTYGLKFNRDHSKSAPLYLLTGNINIEFTDKVTPSNVAMISMKKDAKLKSRLKSLKLKGARLV